MKQNRAYEQCAIPFTSDLEQSVEGKVLCPRLLELLLRVNCSSDDYRAIRVGGARRGTKKRYFLFTRNASVGAAQQYFEAPISK